MNDVDDFAAQKRNEARNIKGLNAAGLQARMTKEFDDSEETDLFNRSIDNLENPRVKAKLALNYQKARGRLSTDIGGHEANEKYMAKMEMGRKAIANQANHFSSTSDRFNGASAGIDFYSKMYDQGLAEGVDSHTARQTAVTGLAKLYRAKINKFIANKEYTKAEETLKNVKGDMEGVFVGETDSYLSKAKGAKYLGISQQVVHAIGDMNKVDLGHKAEVQRLFNKIRGLPISDAEKLKRAHKASKKPEVVRELTGLFRSTFSDMKAIEVEQAKEVGRAAGMAMYGDIREGKFKGLISYYTADEISKLTPQQVGTLQATDEALTRANPIFDARVAKEMNTFRNSKAVLRGKLADPEYQSEMLFKVGPANMRKLIAFANTKDASDSKTKKGLFYSHRQRQDRLKYLFLSRFPPESGISETEVDKEMAFYATRQSDWLTEFHRVNDRRPTRIEEDKYIQSLFESRLEEGARPSKFKKVLNKGEDLVRGMIGLEPKERQPHHTEVRPFAPEADVQIPFRPGSGPVTPPPTATPTAKPFNWRDKANQELVVSALRDAGLSPLQARRKVSDADMNRLGQALLAKDPQLARRIILEIKGKYGL